MLATRTKATDLGGLLLSSLFLFFIIILLFRKATNLGGLFFASNAPFRHHFEIIQCIPRRCDNLMEIGLN